MKLEELLRDILERRLPERGAATPPGSGKAVADYVLAHMEEWTTDEMRGHLKNLEGSIGELRYNLRLIDTVGSEHCS